MKLKDDIEAYCVPNVKIDLRFIDKILIKNKEEIDRYQKESINKSITFPYDLDSDLTTEQIYHNLDYFFENRNMVIKHKWEEFEKFVKSNIIPKCGQFRRLITNWLLDKNLSYYYHDFEYVGEKSFWRRGTNIYISNNDLYLDDDDDYSGEINSYFVNTRIEDTLVDEPKERQETDFW